MRRDLIYAYVFLFGWLWTVAAMAQSRFAQDVRGYDIESLMWAAVMSLCGGALRTIFSLATDNKVIQSVGKEVLKDAAIAIIAGVVAYIGVEAVRAAGWLPVPSEVRFALIVFAGWSRLGFFGWLDTLGAKIANAINERVARGIGAAQAPAPPQVPTAVAEPPPKPKPFQEKTR
jgi:hypothetical protein